MRQAVIGIGSNSLRLLLAEIADGRILSVSRLRSDVRPFEGLIQGAFSPDSLTRIAETVANFQSEAIKQGCVPHIPVTATSAARDARNSDSLRELIFDMTGLSLHILTGKEEARLSYLGAALPGPCGIVDVGGGSTEITVGEDSRPTCSVSLQLGALRLQGQGPFDPASLPPLLERLEKEIRTAALPIWGSGPLQWVGVGGSCTTLAAMDLEGQGDTEGHTLAREAVKAWLDKLAGLSLPERRLLPGLTPRRADIIVPGCAIIYACMEALNIPRLHITQRGNLDGCLRELLIPSAPGPSDAQANDHGEGKA